MKKRKRKIDLERNCQELRDRLGKRCKLSGPRLDQYVRLLGLPRVLRTAVDRGSMTIALAEQIVQCSAAQQLEVAAAIEAGAPPRDAAAKVLTPQVAKPHILDLFAVINWLPYIVARSDDIVVTRMQRGLLSLARHQLEQFIINRFGQDCPADGLPGDKEPVTGNSSTGQTA